jgi:hypothetical protein
LVPIELVTIVVDEYGPAIVAVLCHRSRAGERAEDRLAAMSSRRGESRSDEIINEREEPCARLIVSEFVRPPEPVYDERFLSPFGVHGDGRRSS